MLLKTLKGPIRLLEENCRLELFYQFHVNAIDAEEVKVQSTKQVFASKTLRVAKNKTQNLVF